MVAFIVFLIISVALAGVTYYFGGYTSSIMWIWLPFVLAYVYFWTLYLIMALAMAFVSFCVNHSKKKDYPPNPFGMWMLAQICRLTLIFFRVRVHATGLGKIPDGGRKFMLVSNHLSGFDHVGLISLLEGKRLVCVYKSGLEKMILASGWTKLAGYLSIVQGDVVSGTKVIAKAGEYIKDNVTSVAIAPEGTRNKDFPNPEILPFHPGSFQMAYDSHCPIVVFAIQNTNCIFKRFPLLGTDVWFDCVGLLEYEEYKDLSSAELAEKTRGLIARRFEQKHARFYHLKPKKEEKAE